jgi:bifunctional oligoribonuclease and PAP phosphatase NrnA
MPIDWSRFKEIVQKHQKFVLTSHMRPDCDALGSELGMAGLLVSLGKQVQIINGDGLPPHLEFIDPQRQLKTLGKTATAAEVQAAEVFMVLDTSAWVQLGPMADQLKAFKGQKVVLDHHVSEDDLGAESFKNPQAEATGRLVIEAADAIGAKLKPEIAQALFAAIATDTGWFRFASVTGDTYRFIGRLVDAGARPPELYAALYEQDSLARLLLRGRILSGAKTELDGRLAYAQATQADFAASGALMGDTEDVVNMLLRVTGTQVALMFVEVSSELTKCSFRSRSSVDVRAISEQFGGGGHNMASGASVTGTLDSVRERILDATRKAMR